MKVSNSNIVWLGYTIVYIAAWGDLEKWTTVNTNAIASPTCSVVGLQPIIKFAIETSALPKSVILLY